MRYCVEEKGYRRIALVARTAADCRDTMVEGEAGLLSVFPPWQKPNYEPSKRRVTFHTGAIATTYSGDKPDQLRGPAHDLAWSDELAAWRYPESWDMLQMGLRVGDRPINVVTTTPRPTKIIRELHKDELCVTTFGTTYENLDNLPAPMVAYLKRKYEGTRLGRQELLADILDDVPGALWTRAIIDDNRRNDYPPQKRVVVAIDPAVTNTEDSSETGIIVAGIDRQNHGYVLEDCTMKGSPSQWAKRAIHAYYVHEADRIVVETNNGGDMLEHTIHTEDDSVPVKQVRASRGKHTRAEPISALYEQERVSHVGVFAELEDQLCTWMPGDDSPDRLDALVWAFTALMLNNHELQRMENPFADYRG